jgi:hypothetical protein
MTAIAIESTTTLTPKDLAQRWGYSPASLANWRSAGAGPPYVKIGKKVIYLMKDIEQYETDHIVFPLS